MKGLALGCSHTAGIGVLASECYVSLLSAHYNCEIVNTAMSNGNAEYCLTQLAVHLRTKRPDFVIAQWPNPFRRTTWTGKKSQFENIQNASPVFRSLLTLSVENFMQPWIQCIVTSDTLCKLAGVKVIHIMLEDLDTEYVDILNNNNITLHRDLKRPGQTWLFDSAGSDNLHHSAHCHQQWANRLLGLLNEYTS
jgi:hypothetical protein